MKNLWMRNKRLGAALFLLAVSGLIKTEAGNPWLTGRTTADQTIPVYLLRDRPEEEVFQPAPTSDGFFAMAASPSAGGLIDIVVSIYTNKPGDNNGNVQGGDDNAAQDNFERIIQYFADGVYEMSEGAHRLRNVRIFQNGEQAGQADVVWLKTGGTPHVPAKGGVGEVGGKIMMYDVGVWTSGSTYDFLANEQDAGYTVAHEWGHYFYGVYDEYKINATDVVVTPSIMNSQWNATPNEYKWLNFSVAYTTNRTTGDFVNTRRTAHHREMNASCWETIARNPTNDPSARVRYDLGRRIFYPEVAAVAPTGTNNPVINLPNAAAREHLNIIWGSTGSVFVVVIDKSGSMSGGLLENAKQAAHHLIDLAKIGDQIGIIAFDDNVTRVSAVQMIVNDAVRASLKASVSSISLGGWTAIWDAAHMALTDILAIPATNLPGSRAVFLLTDGGDNSSSRRSSDVLAAYQNAQIPLMGFGYGSYVDPNLADFAVASGGKSYSSPTDYTTIARAFQDGGSYAKGSPSLASGSILVPAAKKAGEKSPFRFSLPVDATLADMTWSISYNGTQADAELELFAPKSKTGISAQTNSAAGQTLWLFTVTDPEPGAWEVRGSVTGGKQVDYLVTATEAVITYGLRAEIIGGNAVAFPAPATIVAYLSRGMPISGAMVTATITAPNGTVTVLPLVNVDGGEYRGTFMAYSGNGSYNVDIVAENKGRARLTFQGAIMAPDPEGKETKKGPKDVAISEKFSRSASQQFTVSGADYAPQGAVSVWSPTFLWPADTNALSYSLEVSTGGKKVLGAKLKKGVNSFVPKKPLPPGSYTWRIGTTKKVMVQDKRGKWKPVTKTIWSDTDLYRNLSFNRGPITPNSIIKIAPDGGELAGDVYLQWQADVAATSYLITVQQSKDGQTYNKGKLYKFVPKVEGTDRFMMKKMKPGFYKWFIQGVSPDGQGPQDTGGMTFEVTK